MDKKYTLEHSDRDFLIFTNNKYISFFIRNLVGNFKDFYEQISILSKENLHFERHYTLIKP